MITSCVERLTMAITHISAILDPDVRMRALARIGYFDDSKKRGRQVDYRRLLGWFVELPRKNLATMSMPKLQELYEEIRALQQEGYGDVVQYQIEADTAAQLPKIQTIVAEYLGRLTMTGRFEFEPFTLNTAIELPRFRPGASHPSKHTHFFVEYVEPLNGKGLLYQFFLALKGASDRLRQCQHCTTLFVQARRKQIFCASRCRTRYLRARQEKEREERKTRRQLRQRKGLKMAVKRRLTET